MTEEYNPNNKTAEIIESAINPLLPHGAGMGGGLLMHQRYRCTIMLRQAGWKIRKKQVPWREMQVI
jgi:hypothetical protein